MARLATNIWVSAYIARLEQAAIPAFVTAKGEATSGAVIVKLAMMNGRGSAYHRVMGPDFERAWAPLAEDAPEAEVDEAIARQRSFDRDLWVIEIEDRHGRTLLNEEGLE